MPSKRPKSFNSGEITGETRLFGIFGDPIAHTLSPLMHNAAFEALGLPCRYLPFQVRPENLKYAAEAILPLGIQGVNVTIPHKEAIIPFLDRVDQEAKKVGAVNTIETDAGRLIGHNTDGRGFIASLYEMEVDHSGRQVILLGAGGAARGVAVALLSAGISEMILVARTAERGKALAGHLTSLSSRLRVSLLGADFRRADFPNALSSKKSRPAILINATPLGLKEKDPLPFPPALLDPEWIVADLIYRPFETPLLLEARKIGATTVPGLGMLLHQGALAFEIWTKEKAPLEVMRRSLRRALMID